jgi:hypothetical protein
MGRWTPRLVMMWLLTLLSVTVIVAQETCSELIEQALSAVDESCNTLDRNSACYGFNLVEAAFVEDVPDDFFADPADLASILDLETIATAALDEANDIWGVAVMSIQANIPNTLPGQNVTFVLMGDTEIENAVATEDAFQPGEGIEVTITAPDGANIRTGPGLNFNVVGGARADSTLQADGQSADGEWLRVAHNNRLGWVNKIVLAEDAAMADLPVLSPELRTSMQAFYLRTGIGATACEEVPEDILVVQGPDNIEVELSVNGANVEIGSTIGLRTLQINDELFLELLVFSGRASANGVDVPQGFRTLMCLGEADNRGTDGEANDLIVTCDPSEPELIEDFGEVWCFLEQLPLSIMNYQIEILCPGETPPPNAGGTGSVSELPGVDCSDFHLVAPLIPVDASDHTFSWTPAEGENLQYELVFYNVDGNQVETFYTFDTSYSLNLGAQTATGGEFAWEVRVRQNGRYACVTERSPRLMRTPFADPPPEGGAPGSGLSAYIGACTPGAAGWIASISWSGALPSDSITATSNEGDSAGGSGASGSLILGGGPGGMTGITVSSTSSGSTGVGNCP